MSKKVIFALFVAALGCFGQGVPSSAKTQQIEWPKSAVTVVFAPDFRQPATGEKSGRPDTLESWMRNVMASGLIRDISKPVEFAAPKGAVGIRVGAESAIATVVFIGNDGRRHLECARLPEALAKLQSAVPDAHSARVGNDK
jgi:hypothetical protein